MDAKAWPADKVERWPIDRLRAYERNARTHSPEQIQQIAASIEEFGFTNAVLATPDGIIIAGHGRVEAARLLGMAQVPVTIAEGWSPDQVRAYVLADNQIALNAGWDEELLKLELGALQEAGYPVERTGFDEDELARLLAEELAEGLTDEDAVPEPPAEPVTRRGDLWLLGKHRLLCGDATSADDVIRLMNGERAALFATDPPYLVDYDGTNHPTNKKDSARRNRIRNKDWSEDYVEQKHWDDSSQGPQFYEAFIQVAIDHAIADDVAWYCWHASRRQAMLEAVWDKFDVLHHQQIIWAKFAFGGMLAKAPRSLT